jgi:hypothetical protein
MELKRGENNTGVSAFGVSSPLAHPPDSGLKGLVLILKTADFTLNLEFFGLFHHSL